MNSTDYLTGTFRLIDGREVFGSLHVCGKDSNLTIFDDAEFYPVSESYAYIEGKLDDGRLATLLQCILVSAKSRGTDSDRIRHSAKLFPHYVALGFSHIPQSEHCISKISFAMRDASAIFYDFGAFSTVLDPKPFVPLLQNDIAKFRQVDIGERPIISYFTGKFDIAVVETVLGEVRAHHRPSFSMGDLRGVQIDNEVMVTLTPSDPLTFQEGINRLSVLLRFFELILGREQPLANLNVMLCGQPQNYSTIEIHRSLSPYSGDPVDSKESRSLAPSDVLVSVVDGAEEYSTVLMNYLDSDNERHDSRKRLRGAFKSDRKYTIDRVVAAANVFDILPKSAYPVKAEISNELATAAAKARELFKALPDSIERNSILDAIGRIDNFSLKHKIKHRVTSTGLDKHFPQLIKVLEEAVNCRNHYVHGSPGRVDYSANFALVIFLTDSLEFSFAVSDLIDIGWDFTHWKKGYSHPFGAFIAGYQEQLTHFNELMSHRHKKK